MKYTDLDAREVEEVIGVVAAIVPGVRQFHFMPDEFYGERCADFVSFQHGSAEDSFVIAVGDEGPRLAAVRVTRAQMHQLYTAIGEQLGLSTPTPTSPVTASAARAHG